MSKPSGASATNSIRELRRSGRGGTSEDTFMETTQPVRSTASLPQPTPAQNEQVAGTLLREGLRWAAAIALAFALTLTVLLAILHPSRADATRLVIYLGLGGLVSIALGEAALWLTATTSAGSIWLKIAVPPLLTAVVIAANVVLIARLMFISNEDSQLVLAFLVFGIAVALLLSSSIAARMIRTIQRIGTGAMRIAAGEYSYRLDAAATAGDDELAQLARWFNRMADGVEIAFERQRAAESERREVITAVSHDLRTPLASVRAMIEAIDDGVVCDPATIARYHQTIRGELRHLTSLLDDLFELSRIESGALALNRERMNVEDIISDALQSSHEQAEQAQITLAGQVVGPLPAVDIDARQIYRALMNLLQNALHYTPAGGMVQIHAACVPVPGSKTASDGVIVQVIDTGEGVSAADLSHIFERTYRGETSRRRLSVEPSTAASTGAGLGLAIARGIIEGHGGRIWAESPLSETTRALVANWPGAGQVGPGTSVKFTLPLAVPL
jgi:signal transduction histidine kinase